MFKAILETALIKYSETNVKQIFYSVSYPITDSGFNINMQRDE